jgi:hypothetical protein
MALRSRTALAVVFVVAFVMALSRSLAAQTPTFISELDVTAGRSTEGVTAAGSQLRVFGEGPHEWRFYVEGSWADVWGPTSDAFGSAYPYDHRIRPVEVYGEKIVHRGPYLAGVRLGRYRTPFGIYSRSDHGYAGFLRAPLIRYGGYWALSNNFLEGGATVLAGTPKLQVEASLGVPQDEDFYHRRRGVNRVARVQSSAGSFIVGGSYILTQPPEAYTFASGRTEFLGLDARWMRGGVLARGEWIDGRSFTGTRTFGGYADLLVHRQFMGPVTAVARAERLDYLAGPFSEFEKRYTAGARIRLASMLVGHVNVIREYERGDHPESAFDLGLTFTVRR